MLPRFPSLENSSKTVEVVRLIVYLKYTESARLMANANPFTIINNHLHILWYTFVSL